jgi:hypothetical protein
VIAGGITISWSAARPIRFAAVAPSPDTTTAPVNSPAALFTVRATGVAEIGASLEAPAQASTALAVADAALEQLSKGHHTSATFAGRALFDGTFSITVRGSTISLPSLTGKNAADLAAEARKQIREFRLTVIGAAINAAKAALQAMDANVPAVDSPRMARTAGLLFRAQAQVRPTEAAQTSAAIATNVLILVR